MIVVAGVDDSPILDEVMDRALEQARWRGAEIHAVHVLHMPSVYSEVPVDLGRIAEAQRSAVWARLDSILASSETEVMRVDLEGYPPDTLVGYANEVDASLLVVGTRGRGELAALVLGSTSHRVIHIAHCDVLVVKPED